LHTALATSVITVSKLLFPLLKLLARQLRT